MPEEPTLPPDQARTRPDVAHPDVDDARPAEKDAAAEAAVEASVTTSETAAAEGNGEVDSESTTTPQVEPTIAGNGDLAPKSEVSPTTEVPPTTEVQPAEPIETPATPTPEPPAATQPDVEPTAQVPSPTEPAPADESKPHVEAAAETTTADTTTDVEKSAAALAAEADAAKLEKTAETPSEAAAAAGMAEILEKSKPPREVKVGERVRGRIASIQEDQTFVDYGGRAEASIATSELRDKEGAVLLRVDDTLSATVVSIDDGVTLTLGKKRGALNAAKLRIAHENRVPVSGTVRSVNKGGFDVSVGGVRAFCPLSQIDTTFVADPQEYVGKRLTFRVLRWENSGRNIVVSRRAILREEAKEKARETRKHLEEGAEFEGVVKRIQPFGAFIDLGGLEGLLHVSRMGHTRIDDPKGVVSVGQTVKVRVVTVENPGTRRERIALALADLGPDPWSQVQEQLHEGDVVDGVVARLAPFGAFVRLPVGIDGLVHVTELSSKRLSDPKEAVRVGQEVQVKVLRIDSEKRRISLSIRRCHEEPKSTKERPPRRESRSGRQQRGPEQVAAASGGGSLTHTMADQLGALKDKLRRRK
ncbi:MAG: S1 RNA-binding domain-containing protein [Candidatus Latescibacterota bacterium]|nr:MAG: S1 RNA-binding domain-containing protein [Candidatus Latescibacterota bacterium]